MERFYLRYKPVIVPSAFIVIFLMLFLVVGSFLYGQITSVLAKTNDVQAVADGLQSKLNSLQAVEPQITSLSNSASSALPPSNPTLAVLAQIRKNASETAIVIDQVTLESVQKLDENISSLNLSLEITGNYANIASFVKKMGESSPIVNIQEMKFDATAGEVHGTIVFNAYFSPFPATIPAVTAPVRELTDSERSIVDIISKFTPAPIIPQELQISREEIERSNPFTFGEGGQIPEATASPSATATSSAVTTQ